MSIARLNECFREGIAAQEAGKEPSANPYHFAGPEYASWSKGWWYAEEERAPAVAATAKTLEGGS